MKKLFFAAAILCASIFSFTSCTDENELLCWELTYVQNGANVTMYHYMSELQLEAVIAGLKLNGATDFEHSKVDKGQLECMGENLPL